MFITGLPKKVGTSDKRGLAKERLKKADGFISERGE
jgi:hypothetical protein